MEGNFMCHKCSQAISKPTDLHLCQRCTDEHYQKEIGGLTELIEDAKREVDCLMAQIADCDILRAQYVRDQNYELAEVTKDQLVQMKKRQNLSLRVLTNLIEKKLEIEESMKPKRATPEAPSNGAHIVTLGFSLSPVKVPNRLGLGKTKKP